MSSRLLAAVDRFWCPEVPARRLAALRILVGIFACVYLVARSVNLVGFVNFDPAGFRPIGPVAILGAPLPAALVYLQTILCIALAPCFAAGLRFRVTGPAFAALLLWTLTYRNSWGMIFHTENLLVLHVIVLGLAPAAEAWSLDARGRPEPADARRFGWPLKLMAAITALTYVIAGVAKLRLIGPEWVTGDILRNYIADDNLRKLELGDFYSPIGAWLVQRGAVFPPLAAMSVGVELLAPLALWPGRVGRWIAAIWSLAAWSFHIGVLAIMAIFFPYPLFGFAFAPLFAVEKLPLFRWFRGGG